MNRGEPQGYRIRLVCRDEMPALVQVYMQCADFLSLAGSAPINAAMVQADMAVSAREGGRFSGIYAYQGSHEQLIGVIDYCPCGWEHDPCVAFIILLMIAQPWRGKGAGGFAVRYVEEVVRRAGVDRLKTAVQTNNPAGLGFWDSADFHVVGGPSLQTDGTITFLFEKPLK